jgi:hypothetical protein
MGYYFSAAAGGSTWEYLTLPYLTCFDLLSRED